MPSQIMLSTLAGLIDAKVSLGTKYSSPLKKDIGAIRYDSRTVEEGDIFCCLPGTRVDGHDFALQAQDAGALAIICEHEIEGVTITQLVVDDVREACAKASVAYQDYPSHTMKVVGITGTNGKTTITQLVAYIADKAGMTSGTIGTLGASFDGKPSQTDGRTTPEAPDFQELLAEAQSEKVEVLACEVSSHGMELKRVFGTRFHTVAFTNLTQDHLDFHPTMGDYFKAKARLFTEYDVGTRVISIDDNWGAKLAALCGEWNYPMVRVGYDPRAEVQIVEAHHEPRGTTIVLKVDGKTTYELHTHMIGPFNVQNTAIAFAIARDLGIEPEKIVEILAEAPQAPGRLELVSDQYDTSVYVDYAHTPDALEKAMDALKETDPNQLIVVFGCGGDRDAKKRPLMGGIAADSDIVIATSDNPRTEDPEKILDDIMVGLEPTAENTGAKIHREVDRREAIKLAVQLAKPEDAVLIAGKGHEDYQIVGTTKHHLDDREEARKALKEFGRKRASE